MESAMDQNSVESKSGDAMSIFAQSIDVERPGRSRRRDTQKMQVLSPEIEQPAEPSTERRHQRVAVVERERARAESELSMATTMAKELERQIDQVNTRARSRRSGLQGTHASGNGISRRKKGLVDVEAPGGDQALKSDTPYVEVMQELDRVKRELRKLQREVKSATEAKAKAERDAETPTPRVMRSDSRVPDGVEPEAGETNEVRVIAEVAEAGETNEERVIAEVAEAGETNEERAIAEVAEAGETNEERAIAEVAEAGETNEERVIAEVAEAGETNEERAIAEVAEAGGLGKGMQMQRITWTRAKGVIRRDASRTSSSDAEERFATASSSDVENDESALTITQHEEQDDASLQDAETELDSARTELASMKEEGLRFANSVERTRKETARVAEEISRLEEQEMKAGAQVQQLNAKLLRTRSRLEAVTAADEAAEAMLTELSSALRQLDEEIEAAEKERSLTELESQRVREEAENVSAEISAAEQRIRQSVRELEAARASEAAATSELKAAVDSAVLARAAAVTSQMSGNVTIARFEYEYLTGRAEAVRAAAEKKAAAAEAWVEALRAGEKELALRAEAIEKEIGEATAGDEAESAGCQQRAAGMGPWRRPAPRERDVPATSVARMATPPSFKIEKWRKARVRLSCLKAIAGERSGHS